MMNKLAGDKRVIVPGRNRIYVLPIDNIVRCESSDTYTTIFLKDEEKIVSSKQLRYYENMLMPGNNFFRIHRSHIININFFDALLESGHVRLKNNVLLPVSVSKRQLFKNYLIRCTIKQTDTGKLFK